MKGKEILVWLFIFVVGSLIVSFLVYPQSFQSFKSNIKGITGKVVDTDINMNPSQTSKQIPVKNTSKTECLNQIKERGDVMETKSMVDLNIKIEQIREFDNTQDAVDYLEYWDYSISEYIYPEFVKDERDMDTWELNKIIVEQNDIVIALVKFEYSSYEGTFGMLQPVVCIDGIMTEKSKNYFKTGLS